MNVENKIRTDQQDLMCFVCNKFYGSEAFKGLCSTCYKQKNIDNQQTSIKITPVEPYTNSQLTQKVQVNQVVQAKQVDRKRCYTCKKKTGLLGIQCKCGFVYCNTHRLPQQHECVYDHKAKGIEKLKKQIVKVYNGKIVEI